MREYFALGAAYVFLPADIPGVDGATIGANAHGMTGQPVFSVVVGAHRLTVHTDDNRAGEPMADFRPENLSSWRIALPGAAASPWK